MPPRAAHDRIAEAALRALAEAPPPGPGRAMLSRGGWTVLVQVWPDGTRPATIRAATEGAAAPDRTRGKGGRPKGGRQAECREAVLKLLRDRRTPQTGDEIAAALAKQGYGRGTVEKVLAGLVRDGLAYNPRDWKGYRLPEWVGGPGTLFPVSAG